MNGFFKHRWITAKWIVLIVQIVLGSQVLAPAIRQNASGNLTNGSIFHNQVIIHVASTIQLAALLFVIIISVLKPWKKTNALK